MESAGPYLDGHERKRGKLADLNGLLRGGSSDRFALVVGETAVLSDMKYVITLDTDTQLARDSAWQFVGAMAHHSIARATTKSGSVSLRVRNPSATGGGEPFRNEPVAVCTYVRQ